MPGLPGKGPLPCHMPYTGPMRKLVIGIVVLLALVAVWRLWFAGPDIPADSARTIAEEREASTRVYTMADVAEHDSAADCWFANGGTVFDATAFVASEQGRELAPACGTDATVAFAESGVGGIDGPATLTDPPVRIGDLAL